MGVVRYVIAAYLVLLLLQINGVDVTALVAGLGVAGIIVGFALQDILKDFIMGTNIVWNEFFKSGDVVRYGDITGTVVAFNVRVTRIRSITTGSIHTISNRNISEIELVSDWLDMDVPSPYEIPAERMRGICGDIAGRVAALEDVTSCEFLGTQSFEASQILYRLRCHCPPEKRFAVRRQVLGIIQDALAENDISIPYDQLDVHCTMQ